jgi:hypothetical protein
MHILFVDESGTPPKPGKQYPRYFVVGGIIIPENVWHRIRDAMLGLKTRLRIRGELKWRYFSPNNDDPKNPKENWIKFPRIKFAPNCIGSFAPKILSRL